MIGAFDLHGVFVAPLLIWMVVSYMLSIVVRRGLAVLGFYRFVWHRALFDLALYVIMLGGIVAMTSGWISS